MRVCSKSTDSAEIVERRLVQSVVVDPHSLQMQVDGGKLETAVASSRARLIIAALVRLQVLLGLRVQTQQVQVPVEQLDLPRVPGLAQLAHPRHLLEELFLLLDPNFPRKTS